MTAASRQVNCAPQYGLENLRLWPSSEKLVAENLRKFGAENANRRTKNSPKNICAELLQRSEKDVEAFMSRIVNGDGTWVHYYDPLTKRQSMEWHLQSSRNKKRNHCADFCG
jgi:hypothetical protein